MRILIATSSQGKLRDFAAAAAAHGITVEALPDFARLPEAIEDGATFEENACKKAVHYSRFAAGELLLADDSGLAVDALGGAPGVYSARYAAPMRTLRAPRTLETAPMRPTMPSSCASWNLLPKPNALRDLSASSPPRAMAARSHTFAAKPQA